jgi:hypothetical protein
MRQVHYNYEPRSRMAASITQDADFPNHGMSNNSRSMGTRDCIDIERIDAFLIFVITAFS